MKRIVSLLLVLCFCVGLAACGKSSAASASPSAASAPAASATPAASAAPAAPAAASDSTPAPEPTPIDLQPLVDALNDEEVAQRTEDDPSIGVFEAAADNYKFAMHIFQYVIMMAQAGDAENLNAYNRLLDSLPALETSLENALRGSLPDLNVVVILMSDEYSDEVAAVIDNGGIVYDVVNGVGTAPKGITPILEPEELPADVQAKLDEYKDSAASGNG